MGMGSGRGMLGAMLGLLAISVMPAEIHLRGEFKPVNCGHNPGPVRISRRKRREMRKAARLKGR